jgi:Reverse transcriptase (RNA-dependent DNA polymerase)
MDILKKRVPAADLLGLIELVISTKKNKGLRQGGALSPLLLNVYLDHVLDRPWKKAHPKIPLIRVVDDLLILARNPEEAGEARAALGTLMGSAGMPLNLKKDLVRDLRAGESIEWLGYELSGSDRGLQPRLTERAWAQLEEHLSQVHEEPNSPLRAIRTIEAWLAQQGPCYAFHRYCDVKWRIARIARQYAIDEIPGREELMSHWEAALVRFVGIQGEAKTGVLSRE